MPNEKKHALRYLLLRSLWDERNHVSPDIYKEVTKTLTVEKTHNGFLVKWNRNGHQFHKNYGKNEFKFFVRGDHINTANKDHLDQGHNTRLSSEFVHQALGIIQFKKEKKQKTLFPNMFLILFGYTMCAAFLFLVGGKEFVIPSILIWVLFTVEFWPQKGKLLIPAFIAVFIVLDLIYTMIISAFVYSVFQYLDPDKEMRQTRIWLSMAIFGYGLFEVIRNKTVPFYDLWIILIVIIVITAFLIRWTHGSHIRMFPLVFVFLCLGIYLDGLVAPAIAGLAYALFSPILSHLKYNTPRQKDSLVKP